MHCQCKLGKKTRQSNAKNIKYLHCQWKFGKKTCQIDAKNIKNLHCQRKNFKNLTCQCKKYKKLQIFRSIFQLSWKWLDLLQEKSNLKIKTNFSQKYVNMFICWFVKLADENALRNNFKQTMYVSTVFGINEDEEISVST